MNETDTRPKTKVSKLYSVSFRLPVLFVLSVTIIVVIFVSILYYRFRTRMIEEYSHIAEGATNLMAVELDDHSSDDSSLEFVFKRADKAMYKDKKDFKDKHGSYR